jgi:hypothetical protein
MNPDPPRELDMMILDTEAPIEEVAEWYAQLYGVGRVAEDQVNDFSPITPRAYLLDGDLQADFRRIEPLLEQLGVDTGIEGVEGSYRGAHITAVWGRPRVTLQRPYVDPTRGEVVDRTMILLVHD